MDLAWLSPRGQFLQLSEQRGSDRHMSLINQRRWEPVTLPAVAPLCPQLSLSVAQLANCRELECHASAAALTPEAQVQRPDAGDQHRPGPRTAGRQNSREASSRSRKCVMGDGKGVMGVKDGLVGVPDAPRPVRAPKNQRGNLGESTWQATV